MLFHFVKQKNIVYEDFLKIWNKDTFWKENRKEKEMWYVIQTGMGSEEAVKEKTKKMLPDGSYKDCKVLYCISKKRYLGQWHEERERFLPGYIFLVTEDSETASMAMKGIAEFTKLLGYGKEVCPIGKEEEELLAKLVGDRDEIGMSYGVIENGALKIKTGVLAGLEPAVRKIDRHKRKGYIRLALPNGEEKLVGIGLEITEKS